MKRLLSVLLTLLICLSLFGCNSSNNNEETASNTDTTIQEVIEETVEEPTTTVVEDTTVEEATTQEVVEEVAVIEDTKPTITAKSYVLHVGIAEEITLNVKRISSLVGAELITINPETTKLYEGDVIEVSVSTTLNLDPIFAVADATKLNYNQYTIGASDVTITTGYDFVEEETLINVSNNPASNLITFNYSSSAYDKDGNLTFEIVSNDIELYRNQSWSDAISKNSGKKIYIKYSGTTYNLELNGAGSYVFAEGNVYGADASIFKTYNGSTPAYMYQPSEPIDDIYIFFDPHMD